MMEDDVDILENDGAVSDSSSLFQQFNPLRSFFNGFHTHNHHMVCCIFGWATSDFLSHILADAGFFYAFEDAEFNGAS